MLVGMAVSLAEPKFAKRYKQVTNFQVDRVYDEIFGIVEDASGDWIYNIGRDGTVRRKFNRESLRSAEFE